MLICLLRIDRNTQSAHALTNNVMCAVPRQTLPVSSQPPSTIIKVYFLGLISAGQHLPNQMHIWLEMPLVNEPRSDAILKKERRKKKKKSKIDPSCISQVCLYRNLPLHAFGAPKALGPSFPNAACLCAYSLITNAHIVSAHNRFLLAAGNLAANSSPLALSTASSGTSKSVMGLALGIGALGRTNAPSATLPPTLPSSAKMTL